MRMPPGLEAAEEAAPDFRLFRESVQAIQTVTPTARAQAGIGRREALDPGPPFGRTQGGTSSQSGGSYRGLTRVMIGKET